MNKLTPMELIEQGIMDQEWLPVQQALKILTGKTVAIPTPESMVNNSLPDAKSEQKKRVRPKNLVSSNPTTPTPKVIDRRENLDKFSIQNGPIKTEKGFQAMSVPFEPPTEPNLFDKDKKLGRAIAADKTTKPDENLNYLKTVPEHEERPRVDDAKYDVECCRCGALCEVDAWEKTLLERADTSGFTCDVCIRKRVRG